MDSLSKRPWIISEQRKNWTALYLPTALQDIQFPQLENKDLFTKFKRNFLYMHKKHTTVGESLFEFFSETAAW